MSVLEIKRRSLCLAALDGFGSHASLGEKNMITLILAGLFLFSLFCWFLADNRALWARSWRGPNNSMIAAERHARANWWCPARRNRIATTGVSGFNLSIFPVKTQWKQRLILWLFPYYHWRTIGRHGMCLGSGCAVWGWHESRPEGWCGLADRPNR